MNRVVLALPLADAKSLALQLLEQAPAVNFEVIIVQPGHNLNSLSGPVAGHAGVPNTIAHAFAHFEGSLQRRGVQLHLVGSNGAIQARA
jgi:hypothetical protein